MRDKAPLAVIGGSGSARQEARSPQADGEANHPERGEAESKGGINKKRWYVYILECANTTLYTGMTKDIERRLEEHNSGRGGHFTSYAIPLKLLWKEEHSTAAAAARRETQIKRWTRRKKLALISGDFTLLKKL